MVISKLVQARRNNLVKLYLDEVYAATISLDTVARYRLFQGKDITQEELEELVSEDLGKRLYFDALKQIQTRPRSIKEIKEYLQKRAAKYFNGPIEDQIGKTLELLLKQKYLDDRSFSFWWLENRQEFRGRSSLELRSELSRKGIDSKLIDSVLAQGQSELTELETIRSAADKKFKTRDLSKILDFKHKQRILAYFMRRGFKYELIKKALSATDDF